MLVGDVEERPDSMRWAPLLVIIAAAACYRLWVIDSAEIWLDEAMTWHFAMQPWSEIAGYVGKNDVHPPLHFILTKVAMQFGDGALALRFGPLLFEMAALPLIYLAAFNLAPDGRKHLTGMLAMLLAAMSSNMMSTGSLARGHAGVYLGFTMGFSALCWIVAHREEARKSMFFRANLRTRLSFLALALALAVAPWFHNLGLLYVSALGLVSFVAWLVILDRDAAAFGNFLTAAAVAFLLYLPQLGTLLQQLEPVASSYWIQAPTLRGIFRTILAIYGEMKIVSPVGLALAGSVCMAGLLSVVALVRRRDWTAVLMTAGLLATVYGLFLVVTFGIKPVMLDRAMAPMLAPWFVLLALGVTASPTAVRPAMAAGLLFAFAFSVVQFQSDKGPNWRSEAIEQIAEEAETTPVLITVPNAAAVLMDYHAKQFGITIDLVPLPAVYPDHSEDAKFTTGWPGVAALNARALAALDAALAKGDEEVWVYLRAYWIYDPDALLKPFLDRGYCYRPMNTPKLYMIFKLIPRTELERGDCDTMGDDVYFPYDRPEYGQFTPREPQS